MALAGKVRFRAADIWGTPEAGKRYEVIDGELFVSPPPVPEHQGALGVLLLHLLPYVYERGLGKLYPDPVGVELDDENGIQPALVYVSRERLGIVGRRGLKGAPDLVAEVLSTPTRSRDRGIKMRCYAAAGVPHYWSLDPRRRTVEAHRLVVGAYELTGVVGPGSTFRPELFPGLASPVDALWA